MNLLKLMSLVILVTQVKILKLLKLIDLELVHGIQPVPKHNGFAAAHRLCDRYSQPVFGTIPNFKGGGG